MDLMHMHRGALKHDQFIAQQIQKLSWWRQNLLAWDYEWNPHYFAGTCQLSLHWQNINATNETGKYTTLSP